MNEKSSGGGGGCCQMTRIVPELQDLASSWNEMNGFKFRQSFPKLAAVVVVNFRGGVQVDLQSLPAAGQTLNTELCCTDVKKTCARGVENLK